MPAVKTTIYKLKSPQVPGLVYLCYRNGLLSSIDGADATLTAKQWSYLLMGVPPQEKEIENWQLGEMRASLVVPRSVKEKVVAFCAAYKASRGVHYQAKLLEKANLKDVPVNDELLKVFFESPLQNFTLKNYIDRINITKDQARNGRDGTSHFPSQWDPVFFKSLHDPQLMMAYQAHLRRLGWRYDKARNVWHAPGSEH